MKEHLFFIETNLQPVEVNNIALAKKLKQSFEELLAETVYYSNYIVSKEAINSNEFVTPYTLRAEEVTSKLTGAAINTEITKTELQLVSGSNNQFETRAENIVYDLNNRSINLLNETIDFKEKLLKLDSECKIFLTMYNEMLKHDIHEAKYYLDILTALKNKSIPNKTLCEELNFWNHIMEEHAKFIDGMLDPTETALKQTAENTAKNFEKLVDECIKSAEQQIVEKSLESTEGIRNFKRASTEGLLNCQIKSVIPPLLADHVLRESNHYLRLLTMIKKRLF